MSRINIAIIGCGDMGVIHAESLEKIPAAKLYACCDLNERKGQSFSERFRIRYVNSNPAEIFNDPKIDAVYIVPEPATICLLGLGGLLLQKRRRA